MGNLMERLGMFAKNWWGKQKTVSFSKLFCLQFYFAFLLQDKQEESKMRNKTYIT